MIIMKDYLLLCWASSVLNLQNDADVIPFILSSSIKIKYVNRWQNFGKKAQKKWQEVNNFLPPQVLKTKTELCFHDFTCCLYRGLACVCV